MKQSFNLSAWFYYFYFKIKGFKSFDFKNQTFLVDSKRTILIASDPIEEILEIYLPKMKTIKLPNPRKKGIYKIKGFDPYLVLMIV